MLTELRILILAGAAQALLGQASAVEPYREPFKLTATAELVLLDVSVKNAAGEHVPNLGQTDFQVFENGKPQKITHFGSNDVPVTVGLVIDTSGSMRSMYGHLVMAALSFIRASNQNDEVFIVNFGDRVSYGLPAAVPFSDDLRQLQAALALGIPAGRTALFDAVLSSLDHLERGTRDKKALVLISDGGDNSSAHGAGELMRRVHESRATIYTVGIIDEHDNDQNPRLLQRLARISGGQAYFPTQIDEVSSICQQIASDIRTRYTIGYVPVRLGLQGSLRSVTVVATAPGGHKLVVRTRKSYSLPDLDPQVPVGRKPGL